MGKTIEIDQWAADCVTMHMSAFIRQTSEKRKADFGEPCAKCKHWEKCKFDWLARMESVFDGAGVKLELNAAKWK